MAGMTPSAFLMALKPTRKLLCMMVAPRFNLKDGPRIGLSLSDEYLSFASPITDDVAVHSLPSIINQTWFSEYSVGGCLIIPNVFLLADGDNDLKKRIHADASVGMISTIVKKALNSAYGEVGGHDMPLSSVSSHDMIQWEQLSMQDIERNVKENLLWETMKLDIDHIRRMCAVTKAEYENTVQKADQRETHATDFASLGLQMWLDEHCGGWANTFG